MTNPTIRFADLECLLLRLGFQRYQPSEGQVVFENRAENSMLIYPAYKAEEIVQPHHWMSARWQLDAHGFLNREDFDRMMQESAGTQSPLPGC